MSYLIMPKRKQAKLGLIIIAIFMVVFSANLAGADPEKMPDPAQDKPVVEEMVDEAIDSEGTADLKPKAEMPMDGVDKTAPDLTIPAETGSDQKCYTQQDGTQECVCESTETCAALKASETCEPGSFWGKEDSFAGCTKKAATPEE